MPQVSGLARRATPAFAADDTAKLFRTTAFGEQIVANIFPDEMQQADEGILFSCSNPTPGTGIAQTIQTGFSSTNALLNLRNNTANANKRIYPKSLRLINTVVGATTTRTETALSIDNISRYSSGGSAITTLQNRNMDSVNASEAVVHFGGLSLVAPSGSVRQVGRACMYASIMVQFSEFVFRFGVGEGDPQTMSGAAALTVSKNFPAIVLGQGDTMQVHLWNPGNAVTAPSWEFELCWVER